MSQVVGVHTKARKQRKHLAQGCGHMSGTGICRDISTWLEYKEPGEMQWTWKEGHIRMSLEGCITPLPQAVGNPGRDHIVFQKDISGGDMKAWRRQEGTEKPIGR